MKLSNSIEIDAPASVVWAVFTDVEQWPSWTESVTTADAVDGPGLALGKKFKLKQPKLPAVAWEVTELTDGASWTWTYAVPLNKTSATHLVEAIEGDRTQVTQVIEQAGLVGGLIGRAMVKTSRRYLDMEATGLKKASEAARAAR